MVVLPDIAAAYGAVLATALAIYQILENRRAKRAFVVRAEISSSGEFPQFDFEITNTGVHPTLVHWAGVGGAKRTWLKPWRSTIFFSRALRMKSGEYVNSFRQKEPLQPGDRLVAFINRNDFKEIDDFCKNRAGFGFNLVLWIDHSAGEKPFEVPVKLKR